MSNRGRGTSSSRARSSSRGGFRGRGKLGFFKQATQDEEAAKLQKTKDDVIDLQKFVENKKIERSQPGQQHTIQKQTEKINKTIEAGKDFISKFFRGFTQPERGNIKVTIDSELPGRMTDPYVDKIKSFTELKFQHQPDEKFKKHFQQFQGITEIAIAIKLYKSSTEYQKNLNFKYSSVRNLEIPMPKKMNVLINQLGKTDLPNDNRIRLKNQHLLVKRFLLRGSAWFLQEGINPYLNNNNTSGTIIQNLEQPKYFDKCLDISIASVELLKQIGKDFFKSESQRDYDFSIDDKTYRFRLPSFEFKDENTPDEIIEYFNNPIFTDFTFDDEVIYKLVGSLLFQIADYNWLKNRDKKIKQLNSAFEQTILKDFKFVDILEFAEISFINQFIDEDTLDDVVNDVISKWKTASATNFNQMFNMEEVRFSDYGSDSQLVEIKDFKYKSNEIGYNHSKIINRSRVQTALKTSEHGAILGLSLAIAKKVEFSSKFEINYDSKNDQILREFVKTDFKT
jgi:hypothetical protein